MKRSYKITVLLLALTVSVGTFWACKRTVKNDEVLGDTELKSAPSDFSGITNGNAIEDWMGRDALLSVGYPKRIIGFNPTMKASQGDNVYFQNTLSHEVTWFVNFKGRESGAEKQFSGTSKEITPDHFKWRGEAEGYVFFLGGETVDYTLTFLGSSMSYRDSMQFFSSGAPNYNASYKILDNGDTLFYYKVDDMEVGGGIKTSYSDAADGADKAVFYVNDKQKVNGRFQYYMKGTDLNSNNYCGGSSHEALDNAMPGATQSNDPSKVFVNAYIYGYGRPNSSLFFQVFENDNADPATNTFPVRDKATNDMWYTIIEVNWTGWKLVSVPYSSFKPASNPLSGGGGNRIKEPRKMSAFGIELESYPTPGQTVELGLDLVTITTNAPFQP